LAGSSPDSPSPIDNVGAISWIGLFSVTTILAVGMSWSRLRRGRAPTAG
jgi:hypothetical protein